MASLLRCFLRPTAVAVALTALPLIAAATDVDGPDCLQARIDFGDAPETVLAYPGVAGAFPTCQAAGPVGTQTGTCAPISTAPGPAGYVRHVTPPGTDNYWLGCAPAGFPPLGIDTEFDGKTNDTGAPGSACATGLGVDCVETAFGMNYGQDECYGDNDAGVDLPLSFSTCASSSFTYEVYSCATTQRQVFLNVLVDWNQDGDWNDNFDCPNGCAYEWAVKNAVIIVSPGCNVLLTPAFLSGPNDGRGWLRLSISDTPVPDDFPWNGTAGMGANQSVSGGETEDYPVTIGPPGDPCPEYRDYGDAPEEVQAYPGVTGFFPTCTFGSGAGTQELACAPISSPPGATGYVLHERLAGSPVAYWLGCGDPAAGAPGVDDEPDGKMNDSGGALSACDGSPVDCVEAAFGMTFGQDECTGDGVDAGVDAPIKFKTCSPESVTFKTFNCLTTAQAYLNILVDWNHDGDWNDILDCGAGACSYEWAVKNVVIPILPGCQTHVSPVFLSGPNPGDGWLRITLSDTPVNDDFPWNGSAPNAYRAGETEDYPVTIESGDPCPEYRDFGDAPEEVQAYPGVSGHFPTCLLDSGPGTQELACPPVSTVPGLTGYVTHERLAGDPNAFWLGCGVPGIDSEFDGKMNDNGGPNSACATGLAVDCVEAAFGLNFGQDECTADGVDAGIDAPIVFQTCSAETLHFRVFNCLNTTQAYLNILVDWNQDGDWNDNFDCAGVCSYEWAVKNVVIPLLPGCQTIDSPVFLSGPFAGNGWLRITISEDPVSDDFPWAGSAPLVLKNGETEDYPVTIEGGDPCDTGYIDWGDAPEEIPAYSTGLIGHFPTCLFVTPPGTQEIECALPVSSPPGPTGYVAHLALAADPVKFWLGCAVDGETNGKVSIVPPFPPSVCDPAVSVDCVEPAFGISFGQDECTGGPDAGLSTVQTFGTCSTSTVRFKATNCGTAAITVYLNILVDWNQDGDWNDVIHCKRIKACAYEWAVKNFPITLDPGCLDYESPKFQVGPFRGDSWMRISLTKDLVTDDYPWDGSASLPGGTFDGGETEDYPAVILPSLVDVPGDPGPGSFELRPLIPNPSRNFTNVTFVLPRSADVDLSVFDVSGRKVVDLASGERPAGEHTVRWTFRDAAGRPVPVGIYHVVLRVGDRSLVQRAIRLN